jgi:hypothetical protein
MRESWREFKEFQRFYLGLVPARAYQDTIRVLGQQPVALVLVSVLFGYLALGVFVGWKSVVDEFTRNFYVVLIPVGIIFLVNLLIAPVRLMKDYERYARDHARLTRLLPRLTLPRLSDEQKLRFQEHLKGAEPQPVLIFYLDSPTAGAWPYASDLVDAFLSAGWHAGMRGEAEGYDVQGVMMKITDRPHMSGAQAAVLYALASVGMHAGLMPGRDVGKRVELVVGELDPESIVPRPEGELAQPEAVDPPST